MSPFPSQTVIDGFDPDKFRKANKAGQNKQPTSATANSFSRQDSLIGRGAVTSQMDMPGAVPTYDQSELQIMAELGVT